MQTVTAALLPPTSPTSAQHLHFIPATSVTGSYTSSCGLSLIVYYHPLINSTQASHHATERSPAPRAGPSLSCSLSAHLWP